ncbi:hypothetical protein EXA23_09515 [Vibrio cincinnatiensis]|jgi:hypothetical protein|uniref:Uncharacterized protein n=1 Tax=Vibrio cincinnatiensis DSM 19608 TaxID=1123491 RepID=A0A1T4LXK5_VIBCI|nr:hypothetical protein [Vibrio cincinnatiensis]MCG3722111.1 hypothetical protein [Vibrio cincinnatiensis]MCG3725734.1 hypothetical protein [Vibrio cincinnatiensis]MCG3735462.1 hypothetical protein [Vibrio cincinnatiensis]MCG3740138.1 hypothetical protein [Vibrio cincinnatiensis]MCG3743750.1 hypothetical protein [Vibrio cincinnatiensis]
MPRFIRILQMAIAIIIGIFLMYDLVLHGVSLFDNRYVIISIVLFVILQISLFVIYKLIEDD